MVEDILSIYYNTEMVLQYFDNVGWASSLEKS